jgi:hypothetical protein
MPRLAGVAAGGEPKRVRVRVHDCPDQELGKAIPMGLRPGGANAGWVSVGPITTRPPSQWPSWTMGHSKVSVEHSEQSSARSGSSHPCDSQR